MSNSFCPKCGAQLDAETVFCSSCGNKVTPIPPQQAATAQPQQNIAPQQNIPAQPVQAGAAILTMIREAQYVNSLRNIRIFLDGYELVKIKNGETLNLPINPGQHYLYGQVDWMKTHQIAFVINPGERKAFHLFSPVKGGKMWIPFYVYYAQLAGAGKWIEVEEIRPF